MANSAVCSVCVASAAKGITIDTSHSKVYWAEELDVSEASVRRHFKHSPELKPEPKAKKSGEEYKETWRGAEGEISVVITEKISNEAILRKFGHDPEKVSIIGVLEETHWMMNEVWHHRYRFKTNRVIEDEVNVLADIDPVDLLAQLRKSNGPIKTPQSGPGTFVISINDTQFGKDEGGGTPATLARVDRCLALAEERIAELRAAGRTLGTLVIIGGGDIVEGCVIYPNQSYSLDLDRRGQINVSVTVILDAIDRLAPLFDDVVILVSRGNHGENRIGGNRTTLYDNDDTLVFEMAKQATDRDPKLGHVRYVIAQDEAGVSTVVSGWRLATTHGDIYAKGVAGATQDKKAQSWYKNMAMARDPLGSADVLITHHFHHDKMSDWGACMWRQTPALDGGSEYFRQTSGEYSLPGMLSFVMTPETRYQDEQVLR